MAGRRALSYVRIGVAALACMGAAAGADDAWKKAGADEGLRQAFERATYSLEDAGHGTYRGANAAQRLTLEFEGGEARLSHPEGSVAFHLNNAQAHFNSGHVCQRDRWSRIASARSVSLVLILLPS